ncbi:MAG: hypothetical protein J7639_17900, partial [Paenibacillaceae bacterium]|nr:hypothetical protein [Paenibacillaceae bacterium]
EEITSQAAWLALQQSAAWRDLPAVRDRAVLLLPGMPWFAFPWGDYAAFNHALMLEELASGVLRRQTGNRTIVRGTGVK